MSIDATEMGAAINKAFEPIVTEMNRIRLALAVQRDNQLTEAENLARLRALIDMGR